MKRLLIFMVKTYKYLISPLFPQSCRFEPSCSTYAIGAIEKFGALKGSAKAAYRIVRCNPFNSGGYDPPC
ncbi:MAG: membrane protein insertion efficiency factor YidD [Nitrospirae bacterium]|uniref:membrane protein insertion efficiency factor YidD n=1 Tax=Candidatus Magnetobacterium casense TaxID=1455061 RepID=UPI00058B76F8|nr:membrane protein insertion efficiency factor YidD [Candidatus Magnetobacterium casensis]MBF0338091.1 membrane protein insertion efficiency factor YidD [Nitrospirota bacterium]